LREFDNLMVLQVSEGSVHLVVQLLKVCLHHILTISRVLKKQEKKGRGVVDFAFSSSRRCGKKEGKGLLR